MIDPVEAVKVVHGARRERDIVVTTMMAARDWMTLPAHPLDMVLVPSAMSHATSMGLGLAIAQPNRRVIVCNGDGSMLMNLGSLVSIAAARATNLCVIVFVNGGYDVTGAQPVPGAGQVDYLQFATGAGFSACARFLELESFRRSLPRLLDGPGPTLIVLDVAPSEGPPPKSPGPAGDRANRFMQAVRSSAEETKNS